MTCPHCGRPKTSRAKTCRFCRWRQSPDLVCPQCGNRKVKKAYACIKCYSPTYNLKALAIIQELWAAFNVGQFPRGLQAHLALKHGVTRAYVGRLADVHVRRAKSGSSSHTALGG